MDKSFNDQELSDIMKEIEALEDNFSTIEEKSDDMMDPSVLEELAEMDEIESVPLSTSNVVSLDSVRTAPKASSNISSMSFKVQGNLTLDLQFDIGGKVLSLGVTEQGLTIEMDGGIKFSVPIADKSQFKKAV